MWRASLGLGEDLSAVGIGKTIMTDSPERSGMSGTTERTRIVEWADLVDQEIPESLPDSAPDPDCV
jgi:hypothetical protein